MNTPLRNALIAFCASALMLPATAQSARVKPAKHPVPGQYIVIYKGGASVPGAAGRHSGIDLAAQEDTIRYRHNGKVRRVWKSAVKGFAVQMSAQQAEALAQYPAVALVEEDGIVHATAEQSGAVWGLDRIDQHDLPLDSTYYYGLSGNGVTAYVIDSGIRTSHSEFGGRASGGYSTVPDGRGTDDCNGHGTHVAGILGGSTYGVAKAVKLVAVRVLNCAGSGRVSDVISGVDWVTANGQLPAVANMSLGGGASPALDTAVQNSITAGVTYAVAADNADANACASSPARVAAALTVAASDSADRRAYFSDYGSCVDLFAPGVGIESAWNRNDTATKTLSGTSMAAPHVAGVAALYLSSQPGATPAQVATALVGNATDGKITSAGNNSPNKLLYSGFVSAVPSDTTPPAAHLDAPLAGDALTGTVTLQATASDDTGVAKVEFFADGDLLLGTVTAEPYRLDWDSAALADGPHAFTAKVTDTAGNATTSAVVAASTANPTTVSACAVASQLLANPGFESGSAAPWSLSAGVLDHRRMPPAHSGHWKAWMNGYGRSHTDTVSQQVTIPADACAAKLSFWLSIFTSESTKSAQKDTLTLTLRDATGQVLATLATYSNLDAGSGYAQHSVDLSAYKGQTVWVHLAGVEDARLATHFLLDDLALDVTQ